MTVRTRFAPSPTGYMHIGNLRTALYAYCMARHNHGTFILRIEDTDRKRNVPKAVQVIYDSLRLAGLDYDEGPDKGGDYGPYIQSQRTAAGIYKEHAERLVELGAAYRCFCDQSLKTEGNTTAARAALTPEQRKAARKNAADRRRDPCRLLSAEEVQKRVEAGEPYVIRQRIPDEGSTTFHDLIYGDITVKNSQLDDQVLLKSDGFPTYNFANVVDDHMMDITHVLRGVEYLSSTPKYDLLYQSFGWEIPIYVHLPHIVKEGGKKLSKREGDASFQDLMAQGFLPQAIVNYIALLGWNPGNDREFFTLEELVQAFEIQRVNKSKAAFSLEKLEWLNGEHIRAMPADEFHQMALKYYSPKLLQNCDARLTSQVIQPRITRLTDIPKVTQFLVEPGHYDVELFEHTKSKSTLPGSLQVLEAVQPRLAALESWNEETIRQVLMEYGAQSGMKTGTIMWPVRIALSGLQMTPGGATEIAAILSQPEALRRIGQAIECLRATIG